MSLLSRIAEKTVVAAANWALAKLFGPPSPGRPETLEEQRGRRVMSEIQAKASREAGWYICVGCNGRFHAQEQLWAHQAGCHGYMPTSPRAILPPRKPRK